MDLAERLKPELETAGMLPPGARVVVGVSGGADSVCLLHVLHELHIPLAVAHLDHGLRRSSWADGRYVLRLAAALGLPAVAERLEPGQLEAGSGSLEERARRARYHFLASVAREMAAHFIAVGHTRDDQAETVLMHLVRGSGTRGLRGMRPVTSLGQVTGRQADSALQVIRPLLGTAREETVAYCRARHLAIRRDATNERTDYFRNRIRIQLLPMLERYNPSIRESLAQLADILAGDAQAVDTALAWMEPELARSTGGERIEISKRWIAGLPAGVQRTALLRILRDVAPDGTEVGFRAVERARAGLGAPRRVSLPGDVEMVVAGDRVAFSKIGRGETAPGGFPQISAPEGIRLHPPCAVDLGGGWLLEVAEKDVATSIEHVETDPKAEAMFDADAVGRNLVLRAASAGDRMTIFGGQGSKKVSDVFQQHRIPVGARARWPAIAVTGTIVWLAGVCRAEGARVGPSTRRLLHLRLRAPQR